MIVYEQRQLMDPSIPPGNNRQERGAIPATTLWGLVDRRLRWSLSWRGRVAVLLALIGAGFLILHGIYPFLAVTDRIDTKTMVVEGWMDQTDLVRVADEYRLGRYQRIFTTGGPVHGMVRSPNEYSTSAHIAAQRLIALGLPAGEIQSVPSYVHERDRTYGAAVALRDWIRGHNMAVPTFVIVTLSVHSRRSRLLFKEAFGDGTKIGVISLENPDYDATHWWRYSEGVKDIASEVVSYLYTRLLFHPARSSH
jgi:hypothetical protein